MDKKDFLANINIFKDLKDSELEELSKYFYEEKYKKGDYIFFEGDDDPGIYIVVDGIVKLTKETSDGKTVILRLATPGELFGWLVLGDSRPESTYTAQALIDVEVLHI